MLSGTIPHTTIKFPAGELHVRLDLLQFTYPDVDILFEYTSSNDIIELLLYCNAVKEARGTIDTIQIPYVPFGRQDRVAVPGESFSLRVFAELINSIGAKKVVVYDPHSDVTPALIHNCVSVSQAELFSDTIKRIEGEKVLIAPDGGALKKIYKVAAATNIPYVVECSKQRDVKTGEITGTTVYAVPGSLDEKTCIIIDDICDGGRTFIEVAKKIRQDHKPKEIVLMVTHGLFTHALGVKVFEGHIDRVYTRLGTIV